MKLNYILKEKRITALQLSEMTGINYSTIQKYSCGQRKPTVENAKRIGEKLEIDWWKLFDEEVS